MTSVQAVVFDIGNVLIEWQPERFYDAEIGRARRDAMFAEVDLHGMNAQVDLGADFKETIYATAERFPVWEDEIRMWHDRWLDIATPPIDRSVRLLRALRAKGVTVFALTNFGVGTFEVAEDHYDFLSEFDRRFISGHMRMQKPDAAIYQAVERDSDLAPEALLFADDREENIAAAQARGWQVHLFTKPEGWAARLVAEGLLSAVEAA